MSRGNIFLSIFATVANFAIFGTTLFAAEEIAPIDPLRPELNRLLKNPTTEADSFQFPYLIAEKGMAYEMPQPQLLQRVREYLRRGELKFDGPKSPTIPKEALPPKQVNGLQDCLPEYCIMKLSSKTEMPELIKSPNRVVTFKDFIGKRIEQFKTSRELPGYDDRASNVPAVKEMIKLLAFVPKRYPAVAAFVNEGVWKKAPAPRGSILRGEIVILNSDKLQPVLRVGEIFEFEQPAGSVFVDFHIYTNHYFDSSFRLIEVISLPSTSKNGKETPKSAVIMTDVVEIDELKKSALIRSLFKGQMLGAVNSFQYSELKTIDD